MGHSPIRLVEDAQSHFTKSDTSADLCYASYTDSDLLKRFKVNDHHSILSATAKACVRMTSALGLHFDIVISGAQDRINDLLRGGRQKNNCWSVS